MQWRSSHGWDCAQATQFSSSNRSLCPQYMMVQEKVRCIIKHFKDVGLRGKICIFKNSYGPFTAVESVRKALSSYSWKGGWGGTGRKGELFVTHREVN